MNEDWQACRDKIGSCLEKEAPFCASACPFHLEVRDFITRISRGGFNAAFREFSNTVGFPAIVAALCPAPCQPVCPLEGQGGAIELHLLEQAVLEFARNQTPNRYSIPAREQKIAIVGAGISGLGCALRFCNRKYPVTIFEQSDRIGGRLWQELESEIFLADIENQFQFEHYELHLNTKIESLERFQDYDAVYLATGAGGATFGLERDAEGPYATARPGVFIGGSVTGADTMYALAQGLSAARVIESYLKTGNMKDAEPYRPTRMKLHASAIRDKERVAPEAETGRYSKETAQQEALRCLRCQCDACYRYCDMMNYFRKFPKRIEEEVYVSIFPGTLDGVGTMATRLISTCNQCGLCGQICPEQIDVGQFLRHSHRMMREKDLMPWAFHDYWLRDLAFSNGEEAALLLQPEGVTKSEYLFFPGCQLGASDPRYVTETYAYLLEQKADTALVLGCCGAPAVWAGESELQQQVLAQIRANWQAAGQPRFILACPTCRNMFAEFLPEIETVFLYDFLTESGIQPRMAAAGEELSVFDPCAGRHDEKTQAQVRALAEAAGFQLKPLPYEGEETRCCSWGGQINIAAPTYQKWLAQERVQAGDAPYLAYCVNCRDIFADQGKPVLHLLDVLFDLNEMQRATPDISARRENRVALKRQLLQQYRPQALEPRQPVQPLLYISPEIRRKMHEELVLEEDARGVIRHCEETAEKVVDGRTGHFLGHLQIGNMTYWLEYGPEAAGWRIYNAYAHRMSIDY